MRYRHPNKQKILVIVGPTSSGKTSLAIHLAKKFKGEVISADSRQVYKGLNIGTGKVTKREMNGIPHHLLDVVSPKTVFTVAKFKKLTEKKIVEIAKRGCLPIIAGGTGFYIQSITDGLVTPSVRPNTKLRKKLEKKSALELFENLQKLDRGRALTIDPKNKRRLIRAIEIASVIGKVPELRKENSKYETLFLGIKTDDRELREKINTRLFARIRVGMISEAQKLHKKGLSWKRMDELGLEYRYLAQFLQKKISKEEMVQKLKVEIWKYAKRQKTWFRSNKQIQWFDPSQKSDMQHAVHNFLSK